MKTSLRQVVTNSFLVRAQYLHFSNRTIHIIKNKLIKDENVLTKYGKKEFRILRQLGFEFNESPQVDTSNETHEYEISHDVKYPAGYFPNQYPSIAHQNVSQFIKNLQTNSSLENWQIDNKTKQNLNVSVSSIIDYYPFPVTYPKQKKDGTKKKSISFPKPWHKIEHKYALQMGYNYQDSIDDKVPVLTRKISKNMDQTLVIYRDLHHNMSNVNKIEKLINEYKPNTIILELGADGCSIALKSFNKLRYKYLISPLLTFRQKLLRKSNESNVGKRWMNVIQRIFCVLPPSYSSMKAIDIAIKNDKQDGIKIICGDYPQRNIIPILAFAEAMDCYQTAFYEMMKFPIKKLKKYMGENHKLLSTSFSRICAVRMQPHLYIVAGYRNDIMSIAINECIDAEKILFIGGQGHCYDIIDRLCGNVNIANPFKSVKDGRVVLKDMTPDHYVGDSKINVDNLTQEEIENGKKLLGDDILLMTVPNKQYDSVDEITAQIQSNASNDTHTKVL